MNKNVYLLLAIACMLMNSCTTTSKFSTVIPRDRNVNMDNLRKNYDSVGFTSGSAIIPIFWPLKHPAPSMQQAVCSALKEKNADLLTDAEFSRAYFWFYLGLDFMKVQGQAWKSKNGDVDLGYCDEKQKRNYN